MQKTPLAAYMEAKGIKDADFAALIGRERSIVTKIRLGRVRPTVETAVAIEAHTHGAVPVRAWVGSSQAAA